MEHNHCGTPDCCGECETNEQENNMSIKEIMEEIEKLKAENEKLKDTISVIKEQRDNPVYSVDDARRLFKKIRNKQ